MPKGPKGEKRPADVVGAAVKVMKIATGEIEEDIDDDGKNKAAVELGQKGGKARASKLTAEERKNLTYGRYVSNSIPSRDGSNQCGTPEQGRGCNPGLFSGNQA